MSWSSRRRFLYISVTLGVLALFIGVPVFLALYEKPTCFDGKQNGGEDGVDCGGGCKRVCGFEAEDLIVSWSRFFEVAPGVYSALARAENPNVSAMAEGVPYVFKLRDERGVLVYERKGTVDVLPGSSFVVFESDIVTGDRTPKGSFFEFTGTPDWHRAEGEILEITASSPRFDDEAEFPRLTADITNGSFFDATDAEVVAIIFGADGNALAASRTVVDFLGAGETRQIIFTWPKPFAEPPVRVELIPRPMIVLK